ncbi:hypothetical protein [Streptomyces zaomyceticus]|uniref:hypothetical protein n=1 Tax=Streptomyces zaomyceticus TaxID=68286 RepID=UPI002E234770
MTPAEAARKAASWAATAETHHEAACADREAALTWAATDEYAHSIKQWRARAEDSDRDRDAAVGLANMWANVASVLPQTEEGEQS